MIGLVLLHHRPGGPFGTVTVIEFLDGESEAVVVTVADAEDLEAGAAFVWVSQDDGGHGGGSVAAFRITQPGKDGEGPPPFCPYI
jgi:hypothetical protein